MCLVRITNFDGVGDGILAPSSSSSSCSRVEEKNILILMSFAAGFSAGLGGTNVSGPRDVRRPKRLLLRLLSLPFLPAGLVGVGGSSSALDWLSGAVSSPSRLKKLRRRVETLAPNAGAAKILLFPNSPDEANGVFGVPNSREGLAGFFTTLSCRGDAISGGYEYRLEGVSGIAYCVASVGASMLRFFFDMRPVDMNAR